MGGDAYFNMFPDAWLGDNPLQMAAASTRGGWANLLMHANDSRERGVLEGTDDQLRRLANLSPEEWEQFEADATIAPKPDDNFCDFSRDKNGKITVINRRMVREERRREQGRIRAARFKSQKVTPKKRNNNAEITSPSTPTPKETIPKTKRQRREYPAGFERLWKIHPKGGKSAAHKEMVKINPDGPELNRWIVKLEAYKATDQWRRGVSPNLSKWIREGYVDGDLPQSSGGDNEQKFHICPKCGWYHEIGSECSRQEKTVNPLEQP